MDDLAKRFSQIGSTMLITLGFVLVVVVIASGGHVTGIQLTIGVVILAIVLRLNFWRIEKKFGKDNPTLPD